MKSIKDFLRNLPSVNRDVFLSYYSEIFGTSKKERDILQERLSELKKRIKEEYQNVKSAQERLDNIEVVLEDVNSFIQENNGSTDIGMFLFREILEQQKIIARSAVYSAKPNDILLEKVQVQNKLSFMRNIGDISEKIIEELSD